MFHIFFQEVKNNECSSLDLIVIY